MSRAAILLFFAGALLAGAAPPGKVFPLAYDQHDFPNGLRLVTIPTDYPNVVALYIVVQTGSRNEVEPGKSGFAHFFEHMMFRGTKRFPPEKWEAIMKTAGAATNAYTSDDLTVYHAAFAKEDLEQILDLEADRFRNLEYDEAGFRTEALAVLGEYNKNSAAPMVKLFEVLQEKAFDRHTYKHTTMGFLKDIQDMPNQYEYSQRFFDRHYRPEHTTIVVAGYVDARLVRAWVGRYWGGWPRGSWRVEIPAEPPQTGPRRAHIDWPAPALPYVVVAQKGPAYSDTEKDAAALRLMAAIGFGESSDLYQQLVIQEQKVDTFGAALPERVDPKLFYVIARLKDPSAMAEVEKRMLATLNGFTTTLVPAARLEAVKRNQRYAFAGELDNSEAIAATVAGFVALRRTPETINRYFDVIASLTPVDLQQAARKYLGESGRTVVTLTGGGQK